MANLRFIAKHGIDNSGKTITNVAAPVTDTDVATRGFSRNAANIDTGTIASSLLTGSYNISVTGNSGTATALQNPVTINLDGAVTGSVLFDGTSNVTITAAVLDDSHIHDTRYNTKIQSDAKYLPSADPIYTGTLDCTTGTFRVDPDGQVNTHAIESVEVDGLQLKILGNEHARITIGGYLKASSAGLFDFNAPLYQNVTGFYHELRSDRDSSTVVSSNTNNGLQVAGFTSILNSGANGVHYKGIEGNSEVIMVYANGDIENINNFYGALSDAKLKENVTDATPKLEQLNQLRVVNYNLIGDDLKQIGLIAQEVEQVFPGLVSERPDIDPKTNEPNGEVTKSVKYSVLVPMLLKAVQELNAEVEALKMKL